jgi:hypothetical protein
LEEQAPKECFVKDKLQDTGHPFLTPIDHPMIQKAARLRCQEPTRFWAALALNYVDGGGKRTILTVFLKFFLAFIYALVIIKVHP